VNELAAQIVALQVIDQEIDLVEDEITQVQTELDQRIEALAEREQHIDYLTTTIDELEKERRTLDDEMVDKIAHVKERQAKMMQVQTSREQTALLKEIEDAKKNVKENEEKIVSIMEQSEALSAELKSEKNLLKGEQTLAEEEKDTVKKSIEKLNRKKRTRKNKRDKQASSLPAATLQKYELLRKRRNGLAIVNVVQGVCQGCFMNLPPQQFNLLLRGDKILECPSCQRLLYHQPIEH
jgi:predicted  nucleic acid-binding Zn-ribbon protein